MADCLPFKERHVSILAMETASRVSAADGDLRHGEMIAEEQWKSPKGKAT